MVLVLGALEGPYDLVGERCRDHLPADLDDVVGRHHGGEQTAGPTPVEGQGVEDERVAGFADDRGADCSGPQEATVRQNLQPGESEGVDEFAAEVANE